MQTTDPLIVWDIDNTLLVNWKGWDKALRSFSKIFAGKDFSMTRRPDGSFDLGFSNKSPWQIMRERLSELGLSADALSESYFYDYLAAEGALISYHGLVEPFGGVSEFVEEIQKLSSRRMAIVSSGPRGMQVRVLKDSGLIDLFDIRASSFGGEFGSKAQALGYLAEKSEASNLVYFGDAPSDMSALLSAPCRASRRLGVGVTLAGLSTPQELRNAGAHFVTESFDAKTVDGLKALIST